MSFIHNKHISFASQRDPFGLQNFGKILGTTPDNQRCGFRKLLAYFSAFETPLFFLVTFESFAFITQTTTRY